MIAQRITYASTHPIPHKLVRPPVDIVPVEGRRVLFHTSEQPCVLCVTHIPEQLVQHWDVVVL